MTRALEAIALIALAIVLGYRVISDGGWGALARMLWLFLIGGVLTAVMLAVESEPT
jgi:hypothetical protein